MRDYVLELSFCLQAAQKNDPKKYTVATALVHVQAENRFQPHFNRTTYKGFVIESSSPATLVSTYGNDVLVVQAIDRDFRDVLATFFHLSLLSAKDYVTSELDPHTDTVLKLE